MKIVASLAETVVWFNSHSLQHFVILCMEDIIYGAGTFSTELKAACGTVSESGEAPDCSTKTPYGYVYLITLPVGFYIGRKKSSKVVLDYWGSGLYVNRYIEKHGTSKLTREVLAWAYSEEELNQLEIAFIAAGKKMEGCLNLHDGGGSWDVINRLGKGGGKAFREHNERMNIDPEYRKEICARLSEANKRPCKESARKKISESNKARWERGEFDFHKGAKRSEESRKKMSESHKGLNNSMYGKFWITDGAVALVWSGDKGEIPAGFVRGRVKR